MHSGLNQFLQQVMTSSNTHFDRDEHVSAMLWQATFIQVALYFTSKPAHMLFESIAMHFKSAICGFTTDLCSMLTMQIQELSVLSVGLPCSKHDIVPLRENNTVIWNTVYFCNPIDCNHHNTATRHGQSHLLNWVREYPWRCRFKFEDLGKDGGDTLTN